MKESESSSNLQLAVYRLILELERVQQEKNGLSEAEHAIHSSMLAELIDVKELSVGMLLFFLVHCGFLDDSTMQRFPKM